MEYVVKPPYKRFWAKCPYCGAKILIFDNTANCSGVYVKCTRGCKKEFEFMIKNGKQVL